MLAVNFVLLAHVFAALVRDGRKSVLDEDAAIGPTKYLVDNRYLHSAVMGLPLYTYDGAMLNGKIDYEEHLHMEEDYDPSAPCAMRPDCIALIPGEGMKATGKVVEWGSIVEGEQKWIHNMVTGKYSIWLEMEGKITYLPFEIGQEAIKVLMRVDDLILSAESAVVNIVTSDIDGNKITTCLEGCRDHVLRAERKNMFRFESLPTVSLEDINTPENTLPGDREWNPDSIDREWNPDDWKTNHACLAKKHLGTCTPEEAREGAEDSATYGFLQADLRLMFRLRDVAPHLFEKTFSLSYAENRKNWMAAAGVTEVALNSVSVLACAEVGGDVMKAMSLATSLTGRVEAVASVGAAAADYVRHQEGFVKYLADYGGATPTTYWEDVHYGHIWETYHSLMLGFEAKQNAKPFVTETTPVYFCKNSHPTSVENNTNQICSPDYSTRKAEIPANTLIDIVAPEIVSMTPWKEAVHILPIKSGSAAAHVRGMIPGVPTNVVAPALWYRYMPRKIKLLVHTFQHTKYIYECFEPKTHTDAGEVHWTGEALHHGDQFMVIDIQPLNGRNTRFLWKLGDGRGCIIIHGDMKDFHGPVSAKEMDKIPQEDAAIEKALALKGDRHHTAEVNGLMRSTSASVMRLLFGTGMFVGGFFTGGVTWAIAAGVGIADATTTATAGIVAADWKVKIMSYYIISLASWEKSVFAGAPAPGATTACNILDGGAKCIAGYSCMRAGAFFEIEGYKADGRCVRATRILLDDATKCLHHTDCKSGYCHYESTPKPIGDASKEWIQKSLIRSHMFGTCTKPCADPSSTSYLSVGCNVISDNHEFGWSASAIVKLEDDTSAEEDAKDQRNCRGCSMWRWILNKNFRKNKA